MARGLGGALVAALAGTSAVLMVGTVRARRRRAAELDRLVRQLAQRDPATASHSRRVAAMVELIAGALRLPRADVERARIAALLHDVGKMDPRFTRLLDKAGPLTPDEWAVMRMHAEVGAAIVSRETRVRDVLALRGVADAVRHHHEWWDGSGYPDRLAGSEIPIESRIIAIADTLDAMTTDRPYQRGLAESGAVAGLRALRGTHLDPRLCDRVLAPSLWEGVWATSQMMREEAMGEDGGIGADDAVNARSLMDDLRDEYERRRRTSGPRDVQRELPEGR
jgi:putative nucleotidyltransferase with HDIG domain